MKIDLNCEHKNIVLREKQRTRCPMPPVWYCIECGEIFIPKQEKTRLKDDFQLILNTVAAWIKLNNVSVTEPKWRSAFNAIMRWRCS